MCAPPRERACSFIRRSPIKVSGPRLVRSAERVFLLSDKLLSQSAFPFWMVNDEHTTFLNNPYLSSPTVALAVANTFAQKTSTRDSSCYEEGNLSA